MESPAREKIVTTENEEFEFRLRMEREAQAAPAPGTIETGQDTSSKAAFLASGKTPDAAPAGIDLPYPLNKVVGSQEGALSALTGAVGSVAGPIAGVFRRATGASMPEAEKTAAKVSGATTYEPRSKEGRENVEMVSGALEKSKLAGIGPSEQMLMGATPKVPATLPGVNRLRVTEQPPAAVRTRTGAGAEKVVNELQRQKDVLETGRVGPTTGTPSASEAALSQKAGAAGELRDVMRNTKGKFDVDPAIRQIDQELKGTALAQSERAALKRVKDAIDLALENSGGAGMKGGAVSPSNYPGFVLVGNKMVPAGSVSQQAATKAALPIDHLDAVRQVIKAEIDAKDLSGKPLSADAQRRLMNVRDALMAKAPDPYKKAIAAWGEKAEAVRPFTADETAMSKATAQPEVFAGRTREDNRQMLDNVFKDQYPGQKMNELVRDTKHDPAALSGVREAYTDWLVAPDAMTELPPAKQLVSKWEKTRDAAKSSKLMSDAHIAEVDKVIDDIKVAATSDIGSFKSKWASTGGFFIGMMAGHPITGAHLAREAVVDTSRMMKVQAAVEQAVTKILADPQSAKLLSAPPTPANIQKVVALLPTDVAAAVAPILARSEGAKQPLPVAGKGSYADGTEYVPNTGLALLHKGEKVVPAALNQANPQRKFIAGQEQMAADAASNLPAIKAAQAARAAQAVAAMPQAERSKNMTAARAPMTTTQQQQLVDLMAKQELLRRQLLQAKR
jgi:hypothetical protein